VDERARADRFHFAEDRRDFTMAHFLLRHCLSKHGPLEPTAWNFERGPNGKPYLTNASIRFNLSHTRNLVACAIGLGEVGIDVEHGDTLSRQRAGLERTLAPAEFESLDLGRGTENSSRLLELWTLKEAFLKGVGIGLELPLDSFAFDLSRAGSIAFQAPPGVHARDWHFALFDPLPHARLAVAAKADTPPRFVVRRFETTIAGQEPPPLDALRVSQPGASRTE
jgi:4'-phosphopantetheinyl transferase